MFEMNRQVIWNTDSWLCVLKTWDMSEASGNSKVTASTMSLWPSAIVSIEVVFHSSPAGRKLSRTVLVTVVVRSVSNAAMPTGLSSSVFLACWVILFLQAVALEIFWLLNELLICKYIRKNTKIFLYTLFGSHFSYNCSFIY